MRASALALASCALLACYLSDDHAPAPTSSSVPASSLRRLSVREVCNAYAQLTGEVVTADDFLPEAVPLGFDNGPDLLMMQTDQAARFEEVAWRVAHEVTSRREPKVFAGCEGAACRDVLVDKFAPRVYRRPLTSGEKARLLAVGDEETMIAAMFQSPSFLYREPFGPYATASELAFFLTGNPPDDELLGEAASGAISAPSVRRKEAERLIATPAGHAQVRTFLRQWLALDDLPTTAKLPPYDFTPALARAMDDDVNGLLGEVASLDDLFTSNVAFVRAPLTDVYGVAPSSFASVSDQASRTLLDPMLRGGILTRPAWLAVHSSASDSGPIARGIFVLGSLLCAPPDPPPPGISRVAPASNFTATTRGRFAQHTADPLCQTCHAAIDGIGFGFEEFDAVGAFRTTENGSPVDTSGTLLDSEGADGPFVGATELSRRMLQGDALRSCFTRQMYRFAMGAPENAETSRALDAATESFTTKTRIEQLVVTFAASDLFATRGAR